MKKICNTAIALLIFLLLSGITSCKTEEEFTTHWETFSIDVENHFDEVRNTILQKTGKVEADNDEGYDFCKYTVSADSSITASSINNISLQNIGYNVCGFEGRFKCENPESTPVGEYGFLLNVNLDESSFYMISFTPQGTIVIYHYGGGTGKEPIKAEMTEIAQILSTSESNPIKDKTISNTIKVETVSENQINIYINDRLVYELKGLASNNKRGTLGFFQMMNIEKETIFMRGTPMVSKYQITKLQCY